MSIDTNFRARRPQVVDPTFPPIPSLETVTLDNGATLHMLDHGKDPINRMSVVMPGGEIEAGSRAKAMLAANLLRTGSQHYPANELPSLLETEGAWVTSNSHQHHRSFTAFSLNRSADIIMPALADAVAAPLFDNDILDISRRRIAQTCRVDLTKVTAQSSIAVNRLTYGKNHPLARIDLPDNILAIDSADLHALHGANLNRGVKIYLSGQLTPALVDEVSRRFGAIPLAQTYTPGDIASPEPEPSRYCRVTLEGAVQSAINIMLPTVGRLDPDYIPLRVTTMALGGYFGSRLNSNIREEKGLTYGIHAALLGFSRFGMVNITCQTTPDNEQTVIDEVRAEMRRMASGDFSEEEITRLRRYYTSGLLSTFDSFMTLADYFETLHVAQIPDNYLQNQLDTIKALDAGMLTEMSRRYLDPDKLIIGVAGPATNQA